MGRKSAASQKGEQAAEQKGYRKDNSTQRSDKAPGVIGFYSDKEGKLYREFSNFYRHVRPFEYVLPEFAQRDGFPKSCWCDFSEKAIMFTKAALMGDLEICKEVVDSGDPKSCKALGRGVRNFDEAIWQTHLEEVAFEVARQKFAAEKSLREVLFSTGDAIIAEAAPNDCIWGIGLSTSDLRVKDPSQWLGRNLLGNALMRTREYLRGGAGSSSNRADASAAQGAAADDSAAVGAVLEANAASSENSTVVVPSAHQAADASDGDAATQNAAAATRQLPMMEDSEGEPLLVYADADATGSHRLSAAAPSSMPVRLIFLDVDGVLNNKSHSNSEDALSSCDLLLPECLGELRIALDATSARVVLSSTWRSEPELRAEIVRTLEHMRPGCVVGQTPQDPSYRNDMRPAEIASFLDEPAVVEMIASKGVIWCAVDDMDLLRQAEALAAKGHLSVQKLLPALRRGFVKTDKEVGLDAAGSASILQALRDPSAGAATQNDACPSATTRTQKKRPK